MIGDTYTRYATRSYDDDGWSRTMELAEQFHATNVYDPIVYELVFEEIERDECASQWFGWRGDRMDDNEIDFISSCLNDLHNCFWNGFAADKGYPDEGSGEIVALCCISCEAIGKVSELA